MRRSRSAFVATLLALQAVPAFAQTELWTQQFGTSVADLVSGLVLHDAGMLAAGQSVGFPNPALDFLWVRRFDSFGSFLGETTFGSGAGDSLVDAITDGNGGLYVVGSTKGDLAAPFAGGASDAWIARFDAAGQAVWMRQIGTGFAEGFSALAPDGAGGVFAAGRRERPVSGGSGVDLDAWIARFDAAGNVRWIRLFGSAGDEDVISASEDGSNGLFVAGTTTGDFGATHAGNTDAWWARIDATGATLWIRQSGSAWADAATGAGFDGQGGLLLCGTTGGDLFGPNAGGQDAWIARVDSSGQLGWARQTGTDALDMAHDVIADPAGGLWSSGTTAGSWGGASAGGTDAWLARFDLGGNELWRHQFGTSGAEQALRVAVGPGVVGMGGLTGGALAAPPKGQIDGWVALFDSACGGGSNYGSSSSTSIAGCTASIGSAGPPVLSAPQGFTIECGSVPGGNLGLLLFGANGPAGVPFGTLGGHIYVAAPTFRSAVVSGGGNAGLCDGNYSFTLKDLIDAAPVVTSGATLNAQVWARDPANPDGFLLSDALEFVVCP